MTEPAIVLNSSTAVLGDVLSQLRGEDNIIIDEASATVTYVGYAASTVTSTSVASWKIMRLYTSGNQMAKGWADGVTTYTKKFSDRATYTYIGV